jgi:magnesium transporter
MKPKNSKTVYADDATEGVGLLLRIRLPWLIVGLVLGTLTTIVVSRFEALISTEIRLTYFVPLIVYISDAVGAQTQTIFVRNLARRQGSFGVYLMKELLLGIILGGFFGAITATFSNYWFKSPQLAFTVGTAMFASIATASVIALIIPKFLSSEHQDPAVGGPVTTVIQDLISVLIYFGIASAIILQP